MALLSKNSVKKLLTYNSPLEIFPKAPQHTHTHTQTHTFSPLPALWFWLSSPADTLLKQAPFLNGCATNRSHRDDDIVRR